MLHVAVHDTVDSARAHYDTVFKSVARHSQARDWSSAQLTAERHRMIHSYLDRPFDANAIKVSLQMLADVMQFQPKLLVLDGLDDVASHLPGLRALAQALNVPIWVCFRSDDGKLAPLLFEHVSLSLRLTPKGRDICLSLHRSPHDAKSLEVSLDPNTLLVRAGRAEPITHAVTRVAPEDCTMYSGGARGAEVAFGEAANRLGVLEVNFTFDGHRQERNQGSYLLSPRELAAGDVSLAYVSKRLSRTYNAEGGLIRRVLQTLWHMVSRSQQVFVVGAIQEDGTVVGGTGWSVELARMWNKDLWVFDQDKDYWFKWNGEDWVPGEPTIRTIHFTGTGTRYLKETGKAAITALYARSFS